MMLMPVGCCTRSEDTITVNEVRRTVNYHQLTLLDICHHCLRATCVERVVWDAPCTCGATHVLVTGLLCAFFLRERSECVQFVEWTPPRSVTLCVTYRRTPGGQLTVGQMSCTTLVCSDGVKRLDTAVRCVQKVHVRLFRKSAWC